MTSLMQMVVDNYNEVLEAKKDPLVDSWLFMQSPTPVIGILILYLYFVLKLGPQLMKDRPAFNLQKVLIVYNAIQVVFNVWLCSYAFQVENIFSLLLIQCSFAQPNRRYAALLSNGAWWYLFSKVVELLDTVFFVLRKKQSQVTFLHVYHHSMTLFSSWGYLKYLPGEQGAVVGLLNSAVHVVMYSYYLIAALGPKYQKYLWWKKYMTWMQLTQFCLVLMYLTYVSAMDCIVPKALSCFIAANVVVFLYLFVDFYRKAYGKKNKMSFIEKKPVHNNKLE